MMLWIVLIVAPLTLALLTRPRLRRQPLRVEPSHNKHGRRGGLR